jgi:hypothetical protein
LTLQERVTGLTGRRYRWWWGGWDSGLWLPGFCKARPNLRFLNPWQVGLHKRGGRRIGVDSALGELDTDFAQRAERRVADLIHQTMNDLTGPVNSIGNLASYRGLKIGNHPANLLQGRAGHRL